jgi:hypothetical protein
LIPRTSTLGTRCPSFRGSPAGFVNRQSTTRRQRALALLPPPSSDVFPAANQNDNFDPLHESVDCCANTVQIRDQCWLNGTANYGTLGIMVRACHDFATTDWRLKHGSVPQIYSLDWAKMLVRAYKKYGPVPEDPTLPIAWLEATYNGGPTTAPSAPGNRPKCKCGCGCKGDVIPVPWEYVWPPHKVRPAAVPGWALWAP